MDKIKEAASFLKSKFQTDELDQKLAEAVSEQNWQASTKLLHQIANASFNYDNQQKITIFLWEKLKHKSWKKVLKTLHLIDFLLKYGPMSLIDHLKENVYEFRKLDDYTQMADGIDRGESVRKQAKVVLLLLTDDQMLQDERSKAKQIKDRMANVIGSGAYFGQFSNDTKTSGEAISKGSSYGSISSDSYNCAPMSNNKGMSFGQSVMKELYDKKRVPSQSQSQKVSPTTLNLGNMVEKQQERKAEEPKKSFNNLSLKLVKPPEKKKSDKPAEQPPMKAVNEPVKPVIHKPIQKETKKIDIMDFDFNVSSSAIEPQQQLGSIDFLGGSSQPQNTINNNSFNGLSFLPQQAPIYKQPTTINNPLLQGQSQPSQFTLPTHQYKIKEEVSQPPSINLNFNAVNMNQQHLNSSQGQKNISNWGLGQPITQAQPIKLSLDLKTQKIPQKKDEGSLIDFSNFRQELSSINQTTKNQNITSNWNW